MNINISQGHVDAIGTYYELQSSGLDLEKNIMGADDEQEEIENGRSFSESEVEASFSRSGSLGSSLRKRRESIISKSSKTEVCRVVTFYSRLKLRKDLFF